ncbi:MAG: tetratricopeptide repeat protein [Treponema sp.]|uniref:tetratricopeptide repeat protein n=1 Tax=Treponema sp. TaxID=166 RepID=UPI001B692949|nr:tetratricopeptide repeat protein [Treponema sp.]MBP3773399.1 tetratricopeptide repeat protein [Treponema sp.]MBQ9281218.1 tetratricopeptide repeat protein [Treponema sp.]
MDNFVNSLPSKNNIKATYESYKPVFAEIVTNVENKLRKTLHLSSNPTYKSRVKSFNSYYRKVLRLKGEEAERNNFVELTDMMGIRVICAFLEDLSEVEHQIKNNFVVKEVEYKGAQQSFREFGYESVHVLVSIPKDCMPKKTELPLPETLVCEIQIRTILQDAWAEVEHELIYKSEFTPFDMPLRRKLASMNASLTLADIIFQEIRDYQKKLQGEVEARRASFYEKADELTLSSNGKKIENLEPKNINRVSPYVHGTIDDMILEAIQSHNHGDLDKAVEIYSIIINSEPTPPAPVLAVIHKHRGMAYFSQNNYTASLEDFQKSVIYDPNAFRSYYYIGIVLSIMNKHEEAVAAYSESIRINEYQSHAHFRRAVSYYKLGDFDNALKDVTDAQSLGLNDTETESLHAKLMEKFEMKM